MYKPGLPIRLIQTDGDITFPLGMKSPSSSQEKICLRMVETLFCSSKEGV